MNSVQLIGRLTRDPDADRTTSGTAVTTFRLAIDRPGRKGADFVTIKAWERLAEVAAEHLARGRRVAVQGRLAHEEWTGADGRRAERLTSLLTELSSSIRQSPPTTDTTPRSRTVGSTRPVPRFSPVGRPWFPQLVDRDPGLRTRTARARRQGRQRVIHRRGRFLPVMTSHWRRVLDLRG